MRKLIFKKIPGSYTVCKANPEQDLSNLLQTQSVYALIRDDVETTLVLEKNNISQLSTKCLSLDDNWEMFRIEGEFAFGETGIILSAISPLSTNGIGVFVISTFSSDLLMVKKENLKEAINYLENNGHSII